MVKYCCVCKLSAGMIPGISFHNIPKDDDCRRKWIHNIDRQVGKYSTVCSQHFENEDFCYKGSGESRKRFLRPTAVPCLNLQPQSSSENVISNNKDHLQIDDTKPVSVLLDATNQNFNPNLSSSTITDSNTKNNISIIISSSTLPESNDIVKSENSIENNKQGDSQSNNTRSLKQLKTSKRKKITFGAKRVFTTRYLGDLCRQDLSSEESWIIVQKFYEDSKRKENTLSQKIKRLNRKIQNYKDLLNHLKDLG